MLRNNSYSLIQYLQNIHGVYFWGTHLVYIIFVYIYIFLYAHRKNMHTCVFSHAHCVHYNAYKV